MKNLILQLLAIAIIATSFQSCVKDKCEREVTYIKTTPIYLTADEMRAEVTFESTRALINPGKIYYYNNHIFINEIREGVHVIDNNDPTNPINIGFISILGNVDISIRNNVLFADNYIDLLSIDISDMTNPQILDREENVFPLQQEWNTNRFLAYYDYEEVTEIIDCSSSNSRPFSTAEGFGQFDNNLNPSSTSSGGGGSAPEIDTDASGIAGSLSRFSLLGNFLYIVDDRDMYVYDITSASNLQNTATVNLGFGIETIIPYGDYLFIGSNTGMLIYDNTDPTLPTYVSDFEHARACDPVYVKDNYAYVTLRGGTECQNFENQLDLIDISNIENPVLARTFDMANPHGLSIKENDLFVCEGDFGFKTFDISNPLTLGDNMKSHIESTTSYDVIALPGQSDVVLIIGEDGFFQYDVADISNPRLISSILAEKEN